MLLALRRHLRRHIDDVADAAVLHDDLGLQLGVGGRTSVSARLHLRLLESAGGFLHGALISISRTCFTLSLTFSRVAGRALEERQANRTAQPRQLLAAVRRDGLEGLQQVLRRPPLRPRMLRAAPRGGAVRAAAARPQPGRPVHPAARGDGRDEEGREGPWAARGRRGAGSGALARAELALEEEEEEDEVWEVLGG